MSKVTIEDVAERAQVSVATVSRVVNGHPDVAPVTRAEVLRIARELGYPRLRALRREGQDRLPGLVAVGLPTLRGEHIANIVTGAAEALRDRNAHLVLCDVSPDSFDPPPLAERLVQETTRGALIVQPEELGELIEVRESGYPLVVVEPPMSLPETIPSVSINHWAAAKLATEFLIGLGHIHIGIITGPAEWRVNADRLAGYQAALLGSGLPLSSRLIQAAELTIEGGLSACRRLLTQSSVPSAVFVASDVAAVGALRAAAERKLSVPRDLSIVGFGDLEIASVTTPQLTTLQQPLQGLGRVGADMLWRLLEGQELDASKLELATTLVERESTAPPRGSSFLTM